MIEKPSKVIKRMRKEREREFTPDMDPSQSYARQFQKTRMGWFTMLIYKGRYDVIAIVVIVGALATIGIVIGAYYLLTWLWKVLGGILF